MYLCNESLDKIVDPLGRTAAALDSSAKENVRCSPPTRSPRTFAAFGGAKTPSPGWRTSSSSPTMEGKQPEHPLTEPGKDSCPTKPEGAAARSTPDLWRQGSSPIDLAAAQEVSEVKALFGQGSMSPVCPPRRRSSSPPRAAVAAPTAPLQPPLLRGRDVFQDVAELQKSLSRQWGCPTLEQIRSAATTTPSEDGKSCFTPRGVSIIAPAATVGNSAICPVARSAVRPVSSACSSVAAPACQVTPATSCVVPMASARGSSWSLTPGHTPAAQMRSPSLQRVATPVITPRGSAPALGGSTRAMPHASLGWSPSADSMPSTLGASWSARTSRDVRGVLQNASELNLSANRAMVTAVASTSRFIPASTKGMCGTPPAGSCATPCRSSGSSHYGSRFTPVCASPKPGVSPRVPMAEPRTPSIPREPAHVVRSSSLVPAAFQRQNTPRGESTHVPAAVATPLRKDLSASVVAPRSARGDAPASAMVPVAAAATTTTPLPSGVPPIQPAAVASSPGKPPTSPRASVTPAMAAVAVAAPGPSRPPSRLQPPMAAVPIPVAAATPSTPSAPPPALANNSAHAVSSGRFVPIQGPPNSGLLRQSSTPRPGLSAAGPVLRQVSAPPPKTLVGQPSLTGLTSALDATYRNLPSAEASPTRTMGRSNTGRTSTTRLNYEVHETKREKFSL